MFNTMGFFCNQQIKINARSVNISHLVYLNFNDFMENLKEFPDDLVFINKLMFLKIKTNFYY